MKRYAKSVECYNVNRNTNKSVITSKRYGTRQDIEKEIDTVGRKDAER